MINLFACILGDKDPERAFADKFKAESMGKPAFHWIVLKAIDKTLQAEISSLAKRFHSISEALESLGAFHLPGYFFNLLLEFVIHCSPPFVSDEGHWKSEWLIPVNMGSVNVKNLDLNQQNYLCPMLML
jgi:hypothetical protein